MSQVVVSTQFNPYLNIAVENYLLSLPPDGGVTLYLWQNQRTVVIGQNQNPYAECNVEQLEKDGGYLMRRRTGGGPDPGRPGPLRLAGLAEAVPSQTGLTSPFRPPRADFFFRDFVDGRAGRG